ncbi:unnamed protein product [Spodoptera exigua]|nr:unnamed protein product [Spodoptera exigua]
MIPRPHRKPALFHAVLGPKGQSSLLLRHSLWNVSAALSVEKTGSGCIKQVGRSRGWPGRARARPCRRRRAAGPLTPVYTSTAQLDPSQKARKPLNLKQFPFLRNATVDFGVRNNSTYLIIHNRCPVASAEALNSFYKRCRPLIHLLTTTVEN